MVDVTPLIPAGRQVVETYGEGRFRISGNVYTGSVIVFPDRTLGWPVRAMDEVALDALGEVVASPPDILLLGCGPRLALPPRAVRQRLREVGTVVEPMDTGAACRTYNVLLAEGRRVAAALIAVG